jgi:hypothetical protein
VFDFVQFYLAPGAREEDDHHLGAHIWNPGPGSARVKLWLGSAELDLILAREGYFMLTDEQSRRVVVENLSEQTLNMEWKKSRD